MPGYLTKQARIAIPGAADLLIRSLLDLQQFSDPLGAAERRGISSAAWPLFGMPWPSGAYLATRMAGHPLKAQERILEIGCGLGLASLVGHRRGACMTASDCHPLAEAFFIENLRLNGLAPMAYRRGQWGAQRLTSDDADLQVQGRFDLIIGSDLLYERDPGGDLAAFIGRHAMAVAEVWIVDPDRGNRPAFTRHMASLDFSLRQEKLHRPACDGNAAYKGRMLIYSRGQCIKPDPGARPVQPASPAAPAW